MATVIPATIVENSRADYRRTLTELFLNESNGVAGAPSKYEYQVETDNAGNTIYLKRSTNLTKAFNFEVRGSDIRFKKKSKKGRVSHSNRPSHANILEDLRAKKAEDPAQYSSLRAIIDRIFNCNEIDPLEYNAFTFQSGYPVDMICKCIKWLFIEQDITYWNWSGRNMLYNGIRSI